MRIGKNNFLASVLIVSTITGTVIANQPIKYNVVEVQSRDTGHILARCVVDSAVVGRKNDVLRVGTTGHNCAFDLHGPPNPESDRFWDTAEKL